MAHELDLEELVIAYGPNHAETVFGKHIDGPRYIICSVPFLSSLYSFCDIVKVRLTNGRLVVDSLLQPSSYRTIRCSGARPADQAFRNLITALDRENCVIGWQEQRNLTAIAVPQQKMPDIAPLLRDAEARGTIALIQATMNVRLQATA